MKAQHFAYLERVVSNLEPVARARIASALVFQNQIVAVGVNQRKSDPLQARFGKNADAIYLHAEIAALKGGLKVLSPEELRRAQLYICRLKYADQARTKQIYGLVRPCLGCVRAIRHFGLREVFFTTEAGFDFL